MIQAMIDGALDFLAALTGAERSEWDAEIPDDGYTDITGLAPLREGLWDAYEARGPLITAAPEAERRRGEPMLG